MRAVVLALLLGCTVSAQVLLDRARLGRRLSELESGVGERPLACTVTPIKPALNFSFRIQAGFIVRVPMGQFFGSGHGWVTLIRVTPREGDRRPVYFGMRMILPNVPKTKVEIETAGGYLLGEGTYDVRWMMIDEQGRSCHKDWTVEAALSHAEHYAKVAMPPNTVDAFSLRGSAPAARDDAPPFRISILMHAAPLSPRRSRIRGMDQMMLLSSLSAMLERLPVRSVRMAVFNLDQQKELYRRDDFTSDDLPQVSQAINQLQLNLIDYQTLQRRRGHLDLLAGLVNQELHADPPSDVVVILGPSTRYQDKPPSGMLDKPEGSVPRFFFFQYKPWAPQPSSFPDTLSQAVNSLKGKVLTIHTPAEFAKAIDQLEKRATAN